MRRLSQIIILLITIVSCNQKTQTLNYWPNGAKKTEIIVEKGSVKNPEEYILISYYNNGEIFKTGKVNNGKEDGKWQFYFADGKLKSEMVYVNGNYGDYRLFYREGSIKQEGHYIQSDLSEVTNYDREGKKRDSSQNIVEPSLDIKPWTIEQLELMKVECIASQSIYYTNEEEFCNCMITSISLQYSYDLYSNLTQAETHKAYENLMRDDYCNGILINKNAR